MADPQPRPTLPTWVQGILPPDSPFRPADAPPPPAVLTPPRQARQPPLTGPDVGTSTPLSPEEEPLFRQWIADNHITDLDHPDSHYDYRGFWRAHPEFRRAPGQHLTDEYKQPGHETFSQESNYSRGPSEGGMWVGPQQDTYLAQPKLAVSHTQGSLQPPQQAAQPPLAPTPDDAWQHQTLDLAHTGQPLTDPRAFLGGQRFRPDPNAPPLPPGESRRPLGKDPVSDFVEFLKGLAVQNESDSSIAQHLGATVSAGLPIVGELGMLGKAGKAASELPIVGRAAADLPQAKPIIQAASPQSLARLAEQFPAFATDLKLYRPGETLPPALGHLADVLIQTEKPGVYALKPEVQARIAHFLKLGEGATRQANWQGSTSDAILKAFANDPELADIWARMTGATSASTEVPKNVKESVQGMRHYVMTGGKPVTQAMLEKPVPGGPRPLTGGAFGVPNSKYSNMNRAQLQQALSGDKVEAFAQLMRDLDRIPLDRHAVYALGGVTPTEGEAQLARHLNPLREFFGNLEGRPPKYKSNGHMYGTLNDTEAYERVEQAFADTLRALDPDRPLKDVFAQMWEGVRAQRGGGFQGGPIDLMAPRGLLEPGAMTDPKQMLKALKINPGKLWTPAALAALLAARATLHDDPDAVALPESSGSSEPSGRRGLLVPPGATPR